MITNTLVLSTTTNIFSSAGENAVTTIFFCNTSENTDTELDVYVVPAGGSFGVATQVMSNLSLPYGETFVFDVEKLILENGAAIWARSTLSGGVTATVSSVRI